MVASFSASKRGRRRHFRSSLAHSKPERNLGGEKQVAQAAMHVIDWAARRVEQQVLLAERPLQC